MTAVVDRLLSRYEDGDLSRRDLLLSLSALMAAPAAAQTRQPPIEVRSLNHVTMFVPDVSRSVDFYQGLFGMPVLSQQGDGTNLAVGSDTQFLGIYGGGTEAAIDHFCLGVANFEIRVPFLGTERFGLINFPYLPTELFTFADVGVAYNDFSDVKFDFVRSGGQRVPVLSVGFGARFNIFGFLILEAYYAHPFQRPDKGSHWGFVLSPAW